MLLAACGAAVVAWFRWDALLRARPPFIADSVEYLLLTRGLLTDELLPVKDVRSPFLSLLMAGPMGLRSLFLPEGATLDNGAAYTIPFLGWALAVWGSYRLGRIVGGPWTGLAAALALAVLPELTYWSSDLLTDVPAAACVVWAVVFLAERRAFLAGLAIGTAVLLRYQCLIPMGALFVVPLAQRRWRDLGLLLLGVVPPAAVLGALDWWAWGAPFHTFRQYVPRQLTTFLPPKLAKLLPFEASQRVGTGGTVGKLAEGVVAKGRAWYLLEAPAVFPWSLLLGLALFPLARTSRRARPRGLGAAAADLTLWMAATSLLVLSLQRYKETRYLLGVAPLVTVLAATGGVWLVGSLASVSRRPSAPRGAVWFATACVFAVGGFYAKRCREIQQDQLYAPFGAVLEAVRTIPEERLPTTVGLAQRWIVAGDHPIESSTTWTWVSEDVETFDLASAGWYFEASPEDRPRFPGLETLEGLEHFVILPAVADRQRPMIRWLNERTELDGYFFERAENLRAAVRLRRVDEPRERPFWELDDARARTGEAVARFAGGVELVSLDARRLPADGAVRLDWRWRLPDAAQGEVAAGARIMNSRRGMLALDRLELVPPNALEATERAGAALRLTRLVSLLETPESGELHVLVRVVVSPRGAAPVKEAVEVLGEAGPPEEEGRTLHLVVPIR